MYKYFLEKYLIFNVIFVYIKKEYFRYIYSFMQILFKMLKFISNFIQLITNTHYIKEKLNFPIVRIASQLPNDIEPTFYA